jgi:hypothetical protein
MSLLIKDASGAIPGILLMALGRKGPGYRKNLEKSTRALLFYCPLLRLKCWKGCRRELGLILNEL